MSYIKTIGLGALCFWATVRPVAAQRWPISVSIFNEATTLPFSRFLPTPIHPGLELGTEIYYHQNERRAWLQTAGLGYMYHRHLFQGLYLSSEFGYTHRFKFGLETSARVGIGYLHTFSTRQEYQLQNGQYTTNADRGNARAMPSLSLMVGYRVRPKQPSSGVVFIRYQAWAEYPYSPGFIPIMTHISTHIGYKFFPFAPKNQ